MLIFSLLISYLLTVMTVTITEPTDGETYDGNWLTVRAIVENDSELPDSLHYTLNGEAVIQIPRVNTDWYTFMGNDSHTGYSESPAPTNDDLLWSISFQSGLSPVVVDGILYCPSNQPNDSLRALNATTGDLIWKYSTGITEDAVTVKNGFLYVAGDSLWCLDAANGEKIWASGDADRLGGTPALFEGKVYSVCSPDGPQEYLTYLFCSDANSGTTIWSDTLPGRFLSCITVMDNTVFVPTTLGGSEDAPLYALDATSGSIIWENWSSKGYVRTSPIYIDGNIYINGNNGEVRALLATTGDILWETQITTQGGVDRSPAYHDLRLYTGNGNYDYLCLDAFTGISSWNITEYCASSSAIADGVLFFGEYYNYGDTTSVIALDYETGAEIWSYQTKGNSIHSVPAITDGIVFIASGDGYLHAFGNALKYTYMDDLYTQVGSNELIVTSFYAGAVAADTISFTVTGTGINLTPSRILNIAANPNPFISNTSISFELFEPGFTSVNIYDLSGRLVASLIDSEVMRGNHSIGWTGCTEFGEEVSDGLYLCRIESAGVIETIGLCLLR